jgi:hypothetical protein
VRAGLYYERAAIPPARVSPSGFDMDKVGFALGARVDLPLGIWLDLSGGFVYWMPAQIENSKVTLPDPLPPTETLHPIANGTYSNYQVIMMAGLGVALDI